MLQDLFPKHEKMIHFKKAKIYKTVFLLNDNVNGLRIEKSKFTLTHTAEVILLFGDGELIEKQILLRKAIKNATKKDIDKTVEQFVEHAMMNFGIMPPKSCERPPGITKEQAAFHLGITPFKVMEFIKKGYLLAEAKVYQGKKNYYITPSSLESYVRDRELARIS